MPIGNLGHNPNVRALIPPAPPLPSQTDGAGGARNQLINSNGPMGVSFAIYAYKEFCC